MSNASGFWSSLRSITEIFNVSIKFQLGQGETIQFWHDDWLQGPLKLQFPYLYSQARYRDISIKHPYQQGQWQVHTQPILTQQAQLELIILHQKLSNVQMGMTTDEVLWTWNLTGSFKVKSAYQFITSTPHVLDDIQKTWEIKAPPRVQVFLWLVLRNKILTIDNLARRGWTLPNMCYLCRAQQESCQHLFVSCSFTRELRRFMTAILPYSPICMDYIHLELVSEVLIGEYNLIWRQLEATTIFVLWRERCRRIFSDSEQGMIDVAREIISEHKNWFQKEGRNMSVPYFGAPDHNSYVAAIKWFSATVIL
jgi:zinc-binding in reverse transcriptase